MKILVTGATGLVGTQFIKDATALGFQINFLTTKRSKIQDLQDLHYFAAFQTQTFSKFRLKKSTSFFRTRKICFSNVRF